MPHKLRLHSLWVLVDYSLKSQMIIFFGGDSVLKSISFNVENSSLVISLIYKYPLVMDNRHLILLMGDAGVAGMYHEVAPLHCFTFTTSRPIGPPSLHSPSPPTHQPTYTRLGAE